MKLADVASPEPADVVFLVELFGRLRLVVEVAHGNVLAADVDLAARIRLVSDLTINKVYCGFFSGSSLI
jgi:hypothetical protein